MDKKLKKIFLSHSSKDKKIVSYFMDDILIGVLSFSHTDIFYTSGDGTKIESGENWRDSIKENIAQCEVIILFITPNYKQSEVCLNEMGAAWASGKKVLQLIVYPITYNNIGVIMDVSQIEKLNDETSLDRVRDTIQEIFKGREFDIKSDRWTNKKQEFLLKLENYFEENPFLPIVSNETYDSMEKQCSNLKNLNKKLLKENEKLNDIIESLKELKDKEQVKAVLKDDDAIKVEDKFEEIIKNIREATKQFKPVIVTIIYNNYCNKNLHFTYQYNKEEIDQAIARGYIDEEYDVNWSSYKLVELEKYLLELSQLLKENEVLCLELEEEYKIDININNLDFWEQIIQTKMYYE
ncbi:toll/interleukin-1 receptor domain-containing protein [Clostridium sp. YIM B02555]|uniref:toll/interleukin-1 receptor domain-containing protein n=1 Tax=Clostridium sp. YIM B02555 TaxID=2911968 RepID=UPI001EEE861E|nr:toll/interleukin-1 receptor domain-containing protein [Clostridium sp. YIM B02555]